MANVVAGLIINFVLGTFISALNRPKINPLQIGPQYEDNNIMVRTAVAPHALVYGQSVVSGPLTFCDTSGDNDEFMHMVVPFTGHPVEEITDVFFNDERASGDVYNSNTKVLCTIIARGPRDWGDDKLAININGSGYFAYEASTATETVFALYYTIIYGASYPDKPWTISLGETFGEYGAELIVESKEIGTELTVLLSSDALYQLDTETTEGQFYALENFTGRDSQAASSTLITEMPGQWTSAHRLAGVAYSYAQLEWNPRQWPTSYPNIKGEVKGALVYDPRASTVAITSSAAGTPGVFTTDSAHGLSVGQLVWILNHTGAVPVITKKWEVATVPTTTTFTLVDPATGAALELTTGGSGGSLSVCAWSENPALCIRDYWAMAYGLNCDDDEINDTNVIAQANICDETVNVLQRSIGDSVVANPGQLEVTGHGVRDGATIVISGHTGSTPDINGTHVATVVNKDTLSIPVDITVAGSGGTLVMQQKRYTCNGVITLDQQPLDILAKLLTSCAGKAVYSEGKWNLYAAAYISPVAVIDESDAADAPVVHTRAGRKYRFNQVQGTYRDPQRNWQKTDFPPISNSTYAAEDGEAITRDMGLPFTNDPYMAQRIAKIELERARQDITVQWVGQRTLFKLTSHDNIQLSMDYLGFVNKEFLVEGWEFADDYTVKLDLIEEAAGIYDWNYGDETTVDPAPNTTLPNPLNMPAPGTPTVTETLYNNIKSGGLKTKATVSWTPASSAMLKEYQVLYRQLDIGQGDWQNGGTTNATALDVYDLAPGDYEIKVRAWSHVGIYKESASLKQSILGLQAPPADITGLSFNVAGRLALLGWDTHPDLDVLVGGSIEVRYSPKLTGAVWSDGRPIGRSVPGNATTVELPLLSGTYMAKAKDSSDVLSDNPAVIVTTAADAIHSNAVATLQEDYLFTGQHDNTVRDLATDELKLLGTGLWSEEPGNVSTWGKVGHIGGVAQYGVYVFDDHIDLGAVYPVRITAEVDGHADGEGYTRLQVRTADFTLTDGTYTEKETLTGSDTVAGDAFGNAVAISDDGLTVVIAARDADVGANTNQGAVYVYKYSNDAWVETKLTASDGAAEDRYGRSVAVNSDGTVIAVGMNENDKGDPGGVGACYVYELNSGAWDETILTGSDTVAGDRFAISVAINGVGNAIAVGASGDGTNTGAVYVYKDNGSTWEETKLTASDGASGDYYGEAVSISDDGNTVAGGAPQATISSVSKQGAVYVQDYNGSTWEETKLTASDGTADDYYGDSVALNGAGDALLVGAPMPGFLQTGRAYYYTLANQAWGETILSPADIASLDEYGAAVSLSRDARHHVVGAPKSGLSDKGAAYLYTPDGGATDSKVVASDGATSDYLASAVAVSNNGVIVLGADNDKVYVFEAWDNWQDFYMGEHMGRSFDFRLLHFNDGDDSNIYTEKLRVTVDMDDRLEDQKGVAVSASGSSISYSADFYTLPTIGITVFGMSSGDYYEISNETVGGFDLIIKKAIGTGVARTVDIWAKGYGSKQT